MGLKTAKLAIYNVSIENHLFIDDFFIVMIFIVIIQ